MKFTKTLLCSSLLLSIGSTTVHAMNDHHFEHKTQQAGIPASAVAHQNSIAKDGFNPPRKVSPQQFQEMLKNNESLNDRYLKRIIKKVKNNPASISKVSSKANLSAVALACTSPSELQGLSGQALVDAVKAADLTSCMYGMFDTSLVGTDLFSNQSLITIADAINTHLISYDGTAATGASELENLIIYLRAVYWAEWGNNRNYPAAFESALQQAFTTYFSAPYFSQFNGESSRDFMVRYEILTLVSSSNTDSIQFMEQFTQALLGYANTVSRSDDWGVYYEENGVTSLLTHIFNASQDDTAALESAALTNPNIVNNLKQFVDTDGKWLIGHTREYQWSDSVNELGRFLRFGGIIADTVRPSIQAILTDYSHEGAGGTGWLNAQSSVTYYDAENCSLYGDACSFDLEATILSGNHTCSSTLKLRYQEPISEINLANICSDLSAQEQHFHTTFSTNNSSPVENDLNTDLEVVIFSSYTDYDDYAGNFFGIGTDNGGMYLEGTPWDEGNQARFIAHQATWLPGFQVWNLNHEYIHYLDGRFNKWGGFDDLDANTVWWGEGLAEYLSQPENNPSALSVAEQGTYSLSELFQTTYANSNTERTYYWGYLATRFMMEEKNDQVINELLPSLRAQKYVISTAACAFDWSWQTKSDATANGWSWAYDDSEWSTGAWVWTCGQPQPENNEVPAFTPYQEIITSWGTTFDIEFSNWLTCLVAGNGICEQQETRPSDLDGNGTVDIRDVNIFKKMLRSREPLSLTYDFNNDGVVNRRDIRSMITTCDLPRCAIAPTPQ